MFNYELINELLHEEHSKLCKYLNQDCPIYNNKSFLIGNDVVLFIQNYAIIHNDVWCF